MVYNGKTQNVRRVFKTLRAFIGEGKAIYPFGDILYVSTKNNENYDLIIEADGISTFLQLYADYKNRQSGESDFTRTVVTRNGMSLMLIGGSGSSTDVVPENSVGSKQIEDGSVQMEDLSQEVSDKIQKTYDQQDETLFMDFDEKANTQDGDADAPVDDDV